MLAKHLRFAFYGGLLGLLVALTPSCQKKCGVDTCSGCCTDKNECIGTTTDSQCGLPGAICGACGTDQVCTDGACVAVVPPVEDAGFDAGPPPCKNDFDCEAGKICDTITGECGPGQACSDNSQCQPLDSADRCYRYGQQCVCDTSATGGSVCRLRKTPCDECLTDAECGPDVVIYGPPDGIGAGRCKTLPGDMTGTKYCSYQRVGQCACGTIDDGTGFCRPQSNSCQDVGCNIDKDCPSGAVCSVNRPDAGANSCGGVCVPRCRWNFDEKKDQAPGCPPGQVCWVDSANLNADSLYYGAGRCKPPCDSTADCQVAGGNPFGGPNLQCKAEKLSDATEAPKRCRAIGECMDNAECPELMDAGPYVGYCDRGTFACKTDCRPGADVVTNLPFKDCRAPYSCSTDAGINYCRLESCTEQGGAGIACAQGEYCCGDDKNFDGVADPCPPTSEQNAAGCYKAPSPPFCTACGTVALTGQVNLTDKMLADEDCRQLMLPSWATCSDGGSSPNCSPLKAVCNYAGDKMAQGDGINVCNWPTVNDVGTIPLRYGDTRKDMIACPTNYTVRYERPQVNANGNDYCTTNADCSQLADGGTHDAGACEPDPTLRLMDGGLAKSCRCDAKSGTAQCPSFVLQGQDQQGNVVVEETVRSFCKDGVTGSRQFCIETAVCSPSRSVVYNPTDNFGCGL